MAARQGMCRLLGVIGLAMLGLATGCADDGVTLHVICPIVPDIQDNACVWDAASDACTVDGVINVYDGAATYYRINLKVESGLKARMRDVPPMSEPNGLQMSRASVELRTPEGGILNFKDLVTGVGPDNPFNVTASGYITPGGSNIIPITVLSAEHVNSLAKTGTAFSQIVAVVQLHGKTNGDQDVESSEYAWPIRLIHVSPYEIDGDCIKGVPICLGSVGQDGFAQACIDSTVTN